MFFYWFLLFGCSHHFKKVLINLISLYLTNRYGYTINTIPMFETIKLKHDIDADTHDESSHHLFQ